jgi:hypothetical protein
MKSIFTGIFISIFLFSYNAFSQNKQLTVKDSINTFYDAFFEELEVNYLHTKHVDWPGIKPFIKKEALKSTTFEESLETSIKLFDTIQGDHLLVFSEKEWYKSTLGKQLSATQFNQSLGDAYTNNKPFEAKVIDDHYGYVFIPGMLLKDATRKELDEAAQVIYDAIIEIAQSHTIKGWIIDLRVNIGGNSNVMLTGLYHLLGNGAIYLTLDVDKNVSVLSSIHNGTYYQNHEIVGEIKPAIQPKPTIPVALISGIITNSAGEFVLLGFRSRKNTIIIGEESYGSTTSNDLYELPFGTKAAITESYGTDRSAQFTKTIAPDIEVIKETNFENLSKDKNIIEAIKFINANQ